jgi:anti-anti-sigma factor
MSTTLSPVAELTQLHIDTIYPSPDTARVAVVGEVDLATAPTLRDRLLTVLHDEAPAVLEVDLAGVGFVDCTGIGALVAVRNSTVRTGRQMRVTHPQPIVRRVLDLTGLLGVLSAPIDLEQPLTMRSDHPTRTEPVRAVAALAAAALVVAA